MHTDHIHVTFAFLPFFRQLCFHLHSFLITDFVLVLLTQGDRCCRIRSPGSDTSPFLPLTVSLSLSPSLFPFSPRQSKTSCSPAWPNLERVSAIPMDRVKQLFCADLGSAAFIAILTLYTLREAPRLITKRFQANPQISVMDQPLFTVSQCHTEKDKTDSSFYCFILSVLVDLVT